MPKSSLVCGAGGLVATMRAAATISIATDAAVAALGCTGRPSHARGAASMSGDARLRAHVVPLRAAERLAPARPRLASSLLRGEDHVQRALPEHGAPELAQLIAALGDREEVVARELSHLAGEQRAAVGEEDLRLAVAAGVEEDLARRGMARVVLEAEPRAHVAERDPGRLAAPAHVDDLLAEGQQGLEGLAGLRGVLALPAGLEGERAGGDRQVAHGLVLGSGVSRRPGAPGATRPSSNTVCPRRSVRRTRACRVRPANGLAPWRSWSSPGARTWSPPSSTSARSASAPGSRRPLRRPSRRAGPPVSSSVSGATGSPRRAPSPSSRARVVCAPAMPPHARAKPPSFMAGGHGEWSEATSAIRPRPRCSQSASRSAGGRSGGAHLASVS